MAARVTVGFRDHTGWAIAVVLGGTVDQPRVVHRARLELIAPGLERQVYHAVAAGAPREAINEVADAAKATTSRAIGDLVAMLKSEGLEVEAAGVPAGWQPLPKSLDRILASHTLLHAAEGELYRECLAEAAAELGLRTTRFAQRELFTTASALLGQSVESVESQLSTMGRGLGPPWQKDHREAAAAAWLAAATYEPVRG